MMGGIAPRLTTADDKGDNRETVARGGYQRVFMVRGTTTSRFETRHQRANGRRLETGDSCKVSPAKLLTYVDSDR